MMYLYHIFARVAVLQVTIGIRCTVPALVYALALTLLRVSVHSGADPHNVVRSKAGPVFLQLPSNRHKLLQGKKVKCMSRSKRLKHAQCTALPADGYSD